MQTATRPLAADTLFQISFGFLPSRVLMTALQLDLFSAMKDGPRTAAEVAQHAQASERGTRMILDVLVSLQILERDGERYRLAPSAARHLVRGGEEYIGAMFERDDMWQGWGQLTETVRSGVPQRKVEEEELASQFFPMLVKSLHVIHRDAAVRAAEALKLPAEAHVLDVAAGSAAWSIPFAEQSPTVRVTALDFPVVLDTTRKYVERHGVSQQFAYLEGNLKDADLGEGRYDLALLGNIVHSEGETSTRDLLRRLHRALRPGGQVAILDMVPADDRSGPVFPLAFALNMLLHTSEGDTYTFAELSSWLHEAGFKDARTIDIGSHSPMVVATRA